MNRDDIEVLRVSGFYQTRGRGLYVFSPSQVVTGAPEPAEVVEHLAKIKETILELDTLICDDRSHTKSLIENAKNLIEVMEKELFQVKSLDVGYYFREGLIKKVNRTKPPAKDFEDHALIRRCRNREEREFCSAVLQLTPMFNSGRMKYFKTELKKAKDLAETLLKREMIF